MVTVTCVLGTTAQDSGTKGGMGAQLGGFHLTDPNREPFLQRTVKELCSEVFVSNLFSQLELKACGPVDRKLA